MAVEDAHCSSLWKLGSSSWGRQVSKNVNSVGDQYPQLCSLSCHRFSIFKIALTAKARSSDGCAVDSTGVRTGTDVDVVAKRKFGVWPRWR